MERSLEYQTRHRKLLILQALRATVRLVSVSKGAEVRLAAAQMNRGGRPRLPIDAELIAQLRGAGHSWRSIARQVGVGYGTVRRAYQRRAKTVPKPILAGSLLALGLLPGLARAQGGVPASPIAILSSSGRPIGGVMKGRVLVAIAVTGLIYLGATNICNRSSSSDLSASMGLREGAKITSLTYSLVECLRALSERRPAANSSAPARVSAAAMIRPRINEGKAVPKSS